MKFQGASIGKGPRGPKYVKNRFFINFSNFHFFRKFQNFEISFFIDPGLDFKIPGGSGSQK